MGANCISNTIPCVSHHFYFFVINIHKVTIHSAHSNILSFNVVSLRVAVIELSGDNLSMGEGNIEHALRDHRSNTVSR